MNRHPRWWIGIAAGAAFLALVQYGRASAAEVYTDESIRELFRRSPRANSIHELMSKQHGRLHAILDAFLTGDLETVAVQADAVHTGMKEIVRLFSEKENADDEMIMAIASEILKRSAIVADEARKNNYRDAYVNYTFIGAQCIRCHQTARDWGKMPEPDLEQPSQPDSSDTSVTK